MSPHGHAFQGVVADSELGVLQGQKVSGTNPLGTLTELLGWGLALAPFPGLVLVAPDGLNQEH